MESSESAFPLLPELLESKKKGEIIPGRLTFPLLPELLESKKKGEIIPGRLTKEVWEESKKLWEVVGPGVFMQLAIYTMIVISQAFVGHLGDRDLAAFSIANTVIDGLSFGFLVCDVSLILLPIYAALVIVVIWCLIEGIDFWGTESSTA
ncbi:hypothetical protein PR202_ga15575 [Eleusine coracana subsp. coracana]|uniref:Uncharacterized protein n=1 Tax=Eleusine coracana subsp. coracana TaxID=191504 RepID=A0AAV5CKK7_ELECO|nr:hypothetical protein PR202_ga15575 [Eleusine coracana subsp. coracana]